MSWSNFQYFNQVKKEPTFASQSPPPKSNYSSIAQHLHTTAAILLVNNNRTQKKKDTPTTGPATINSMIQGL